MHGLRKTAWTILIAAGLHLGCPAAGLRTVVIGDSLSAEYDALPDIPGVDDPTEYAAVTVPGWEALSWVEVLGRLRPDDLDFGSFRTTLPGWNDLRFTGYKYNFAIPGFTAAQYEDIVNSSLFSNPQYWLQRTALRDELADAEACVVWVGANEIRADYRFLCEGGNPTNIIKGLRRDVAEILDFVRDAAPSIKVLLVNLPDLGAAPSKQAENPDPEKRRRASAAIALANQSIAEIAAAREVPVADAFESTRRVVEGECLQFGGVTIRCASDADNDPRYAFTREGLHPNTALQIEIGRLIVSELNDAYGAGIPAISDAEALSLLGLSPQIAYEEWAAQHGLQSPAYGEDPDQDGLPNIAEFVFGCAPKERSECPVSFAISGESVIASYSPVPDRTGLVTFTPMVSTNLKDWAVVSPDQLTVGINGRVIIKLGASSHCSFLRLELSPATQP